MAAQIEELVLENFRISENDFRDVDAIIRKHCDTVKYYIHKSSTVGGYDTGDVEDLVKDRNGGETRIRSVMLHATGIDGLKFNIDFDNFVGINGECEDRARLVLLATETKSVIRDRIKSGTPRRNAILQGFVLIFLLLGYFGFQQIQDSYINRFNAALATQDERLSAPYQQELSTTTQRLLSQATSALSRHNLAAEVDFLVQQQIGQLRQQISAQQGAASADSTPPSWSTSFWLLLAVAAAAATVGFGIGYLLFPSNRSVFLIGDEKRRQDRADKRRKATVGIAITLILGVVSSIIASAALR
jgi:hypothetical protein